MALFALIAASCIAHGSVVTYHGPADRLEVIMAAIGKQTGDNLQPTPQIADLPIFLRCDNQPVEMVYKRLAAAVNGHWERDSRAYRLVRDGRDTANEAKQDTETDRIQIEKRLSEFRAKAKKQSAYTEEAATGLIRRALLMKKEMAAGDLPQSWYKRVAALESGGPGYRAIERAIAALDSATLAKLPQGIKVVFSNQPNPIQYPLSSALLGVFGQAVSERNVYAGAAARAGLRAPVDPDEEDTFSSLLTQVSTVTGPTRFWMGLTYESGSRLNVQLKVLDKDGAPVIDETDSLWLSREMPDGRRWSDLVAGPPPEPMVTFDSNRKAIIENLALRRDLVNRTRLPQVALNQTVRNLVLKMDSIEPSLYVLTDILERALPAGPAIAVINDTLLVNALAQPLEWPVQKAVRLLQGSGSVESVDGWTQYRPDLMGRFFDRRISRSDQDSTLRLADAKASLTIEDQARIAYLFGESGWDLLTVFLDQRLKVPSGHSTLSDFDRYHWLYGSLSSSLRDQAFQKGVLISNLSRAQIRVITRLVYEEYSHMELDFDAARAGGINVDLSSRNLKHYNDGVGQEPTELLPNGIPPGASLKLKESVKEVVVAERGSNDSTPAEKMTPQEFGMNLYMLAHPDIFTWVDTKTAPPKKFRVQKQRTILVKLDFMPGLALSETLSEDQNSEGKFVDYADLSASFRVQVDTAFAQAKERFKNAKPGDYGSPPGRSGSTIPPL